MSRIPIFKSKSPALASILILSLLSAVASAIPPAWWSTRNVIDATKPQNDYAAANQGQLKHIAARARDEFNVILQTQGGAGTTINTIVDGWANASNASDYAVCNIGQVKALAKPFWDRFIAIGSAISYPWTTTTIDDDDFAPANIGQLKTIFSFDFEGDRDNDGILDIWELRMFGSLARNGSGDFDSDGLTDFQEYKIGTDATNIDSDLDGVSDYNEVQRGSSPLDAVNLTVFRP